MGLIGFPETSVDCTSICLVTPQKGKGLALSLVITVGRERIFAVLFGSITYATRRTSLYFLTINQIYKFLHVSRRTVHTALTRIWSADCKIRTFLRGAQVNFVYTLGVSVCWCVLGMKGINHVSERTWRNIGYTSRRVYSDFSPWNHTSGLSLSDPFTWTCGLPYPSDYEAQDTNWTKQHTLQKSL
jgi:hypothetical protein